MWPKVGLGSNRTGTACPKDTQAAQDEPPPSPQKRTALRKSWAQLIRRVYLTDPLEMFSVAASSA